MAKQSAVKCVLIEGRSLREAATESKDSGSLECTGRQHFDSALLRAVEDSVLAQDDSPVNDIFKLLHSSLQK